MRFLVEFNKTLQGRSLWRFMGEPIILFRKVIVTKFGLDNYG